MANLFSLIDKNKFLYTMRIQRLIHSHTTEIWWHRHSGHMCNHLHTRRRFVKGHYSSPNCLESTSPLSAQSFCDSSVRMAMTRSMTRKQNQDTCSRKRSKTCKNSGSASWSDLCHDMLFLLILKLGIADFVAFSGVCQAWRSVALSNRNMFMASRKPMMLSFSSGSKKKECYLEELNGRMFKTVVPHSSHRTCVGLTCGYLILFGRRNRDFRLVNPITRHEPYFPHYPFRVDTMPGGVRAILVFSPSLSGWVFVLARKLSKIVSFSLPKQSCWNHITSGFPIHDLHAFQGKIYAISTCTRLCEVRLDPKPTLTLVLEMHYPYKFILPELVSSGERLSVFDGSSLKAIGIDVNQMKWVTPPRTKKEYTLLLSKTVYGSSTKLVIWDDIRTYYERFGYFNDSDQGEYNGRFIKSDMWYLPHDCLNVNLLHE